MQSSPTILLYTINQTPLYTQFYVPYDQKLFYFNKKKPEYEKVFNSGGESGWVDWMVGCEKNAGSRMDFDEWYCVSKKSGKFDESEWISNLTE